MSASSRMPDGRNPTVKNKLKSRTITDDEPQKLADVLDADLPTGTGKRDNKVLIKGHSGPIITNFQVRRSVAPAEPAGPAPPCRIFHFSGLSASLLDF
jgi:hypothetical protein